ncbi:MAG: Crp/Fnr family transcriptional regulator [Bdellovibrionaceae bacterium]|nr:Crp/Fnr family transcriptional regulator [Pseudobdellovibrionaceae bacterium]
MVSSPQACTLCDGRADSPLCNHDKLRALICEARQFSKFRPGQTIFHSGGHPMGIYVVTSGRVKLEALTDNGTALTLRLLGPGGVLGYRALFAGEPSQASAIAVDEVQACFIPKGHLMQVLNEQPEAALRLIQYACKDLRIAEEKWIGQINKDATARVAEAVLFLNDHFMNQYWTRREIAQWAGTTPETVM